MSSVFLEGTRDARARGYAPVRALPAVALLIAAWMIFARLGGLPLMDPDEGRNSEVGREMMASGAWLVPTFDGLPYLDKPAFFFRCVALSFSLFGVSEAAARLPSALSAAAILVMLWAFCRRRYGELAASLAVIVASTAPLFFIFSRLVIMDAMLGCFVCAAIFAAYQAEEVEGRGRRLWYLASAVAAGCATLVKGPVGFLVPALAVSVFNRLDGRRGAIRRCFAPVNVLAFLVVVLPWFLGLSAREPGFFYYGLVEESFQRFTTGGSFHRSEPFYYYAPVVIAGLFPWSLLLPESMIAAWRNRSRWSSADRLFLVWAAVVVIFFSVSSSKRPAYVLTAVVALSALTGRVLALAWEDPSSRAARIVLRGAAAAVLLCGVGTVALVVLFQRPGPSDAARQGFPLLAAGLAVSAVTALAARLRRDSGLAVAGLALVPLCLLSAGFPAVEAYAGTRTEKDLAARIGPLPANADLACLECFPESLTFYERRPVVVISAGASPGELASNFLLFRWRRQGLKADSLVDLNRLDAWLAERRRPVFLLADPPELGRLRALAAARGLPVVQLAPDWWGISIPARRGG